MIGQPEAKSLAVDQSTAAAIEHALIDADLGGLSPQQRVAFYHRTCDSLGLNPLTKPFEYLRLNNKTILYATKSCTEQLRSLHNVSIELVEKVVVEGVYCVTARATLPNGRRDESVGAVTLEGLKGEARANALMKTETKAKRRVTLSICGLAFLDETEVDTIPGAQRVDRDVSYDLKTGEITSPSAAPRIVMVEDARHAQDGNKQGAFFSHELALVKAKTIAELRVAWDAVCDDAKRQRITLEQRGQLLDQKNRCGKAIKAGLTEELSKSLETPHEGREPWDLQSEEGSQ
jgi:hypothetical protein